MSRHELRHPATQTFGERLRLARAAAGLTQEALARSASVTLRTVQRWEDGTSEPKFGQVVVIAAALGVEATNLYPVVEREAAA